MLFKFDSKVVKSLGFGDHEIWEEVLAQPHPSSVNLGKGFRFSGPPWQPLYTGLMTLISQG